MNERMSDRMNDRMNELRVDPSRAARRAASSGG